MACASGFMEPTTGSTRHMRWLYLLLEGGAAVLRDIFDKHVPKTQLSMKLNSPQTKLKLLKLHKQGIITDIQKDLLYPHSGQPDSSTFDITLLSCLLKNIGGLNSQAQAWSGIISSDDFRVEADICRLRDIRNQASHASETALTESAFQEKWDTLVEILVRLGKNIPNLKDRIECYKSTSIDKECEQSLKIIMSEWEELDKVHQNVVSVIKDEQQKQARELDSLAETVSRNEQDLTLKLIDTIRDQDQLREDTSALTEDVVVIRDTQEQMKADIEKVRAERERAENSMSSELRGIASKSKMQVQDAIDTNEMYVEISSFTKARELLSEKGVVVISGHPGEGKTTMALNLAAKISKPEKCLVIRSPSDWKHVDLSLDLFDMVIMDDIYGAGVMNDSLVKKWERHLPDIQTAVKRKKIKVIIATRHYILQDAKEIMKRQPLFNQENVILLSSKDLSDVERSEILRVHLKKRRRDFEETLIGQCLAMFTGFIDALFNFDTRDFIFGFPQCVEMFANNNSLYRRGAGFFNRPNEFFRDCIEDIRQEDEKFLALIMIWARQDKPLLRSDLDISDTSHQLQRIAKSFGFKLKPKMMKVLRKSLKHHEGGFVEFHERDGSYTFSHNIIADMVGLVLGKEYPEETLKYCSRDFLLEFVTTNEDNGDDFHFFIEEYLYEKLSERILKLFLDPLRTYYDENVNMFKSGGNCPNKIITSNTLDSGMVMCGAFSTEKFVKAFIETLINSKNESRCEQFLETPVLKMSGHFLGMGVSLTETEIKLPLYFLLHKNIFLIKELIKRNFINKLEDHFEIMMMISVYNCLEEFVLFLIEIGAHVTEEMIYIAAMDENTSMMKLLLQKRTNFDGIIEKKCQLFNGSTALIAAAKKGYTESVKCLIEYGVDIFQKNEDGLCALDKAAYYGHADVCQILIDRGSPVDKKSGKFKRTVLHAAADMGKENVVRLLLQKGASTSIKDHKGHFAIHCAAFRGYASVVKAFLEHDIKLAKQRILSYCDKSTVKGMTVFHIAVMKKNFDLLDTLMQLGADPNVPDIYGRTPLYHAVYDGKKDIVEKLLDYSDLSKPDKNGFTPLLAAIHKDHIDIAYLLCPNVDVNVCDKYGCTPLLKAIQKGHLKFAMTLISDFNADIRNKASLKVLRKLLNNISVLGEFEDFIYGNTISSEIVCNAILQLDPNHVDYCLTFMK